MLKKLLYSLLLVVIISVAGGIGYSVYSPIVNAPPPVTQLSSMCEVADGVAYRAIVGQIGTADASNLYREIRDLKRMGIREVHFYMNSPGGSLSDTFALYDAMKNLSEEGIITVADIEGACYSATVLLASACDYRTASANTIFMVHQPIGNDVDVMKMFAEKYAQLLEDNTNLTQQQWLTKMDMMEWFGSEEALEYGLIDEIK